MEGPEMEFSQIEKKWQDRWEEKEIFHVSEGRKNKFYVLEMFPYPSGSGLHMGHAFNYTVGDIFARFKRMQGFNVLYPMGYDSFGLPAENAAIKEGIHPKKFTDDAIANFIRQQKSLGLSYDWDRLITTSSPEYYRWNQFFFLKFMEKGLVYRKKAAVNYCPKCETVLANEQVHGGKCWRHTDTDVEIRQLEQWFVRTTKYSDELLEFLPKIEWPERIKVMQQNWIGKSYGSEAVFRINGEDWNIFTTRLDTIYGVTFMVISAQHPRLMDIVTKEKKGDVEEFLRKVRSTSEKDVLEKEGVFTGSYAVNPINGEKVPVYAGNFVIADYGSGMVMAVPAHDQRDFEFAKKYGIPIKAVISPDAKGSTNIEKAFTEYGFLINSGEFSGMKSKDAIERITERLEAKKLGRKAVQYKFRDWLISRQRYWGTPIPVIYCEKDGIVPVPEKDLPVRLPENVTFGKGNPLTTSKEFLNVKCPICGGNAKRESDTMDTFFDSSWYYLRYCDSKNGKEPFSAAKVGYWTPIDQYIGGAEHANMHLIYARFFTKALRDLGFLKMDEPFTRLFNQGMLHGEDGFVMSKSRGNVVLPEVVSQRYGIDTARLFLVSVASPDKDVQWSENGIEGSFRFVKRVMKYLEEVKIGKSSSKVESKLNMVIKSVTENISKFNYNIAYLELRALFDRLEPEVGKETLEVFLKLLHPFCPHITEELWERIGNKGLLSLEPWPIADESKIDESFEKQEKDAEKLAEDIANIAKIFESKGRIVTKAYVYVLPNEKVAYQDNLETVRKRVGLEIAVFAVNDKEKYDPQGKAGKAKPGKPGIYLE
jgi:leucyl-tRNA synthetase